MLIIAYIPLLFALIGLLMYVLAANGKVQEIGRLVFACGWLVMTFTLASKVIRLP